MVQQFVLTRQELEELKQKLYTITTMIEYINKTTNEFNRETEYIRLAVHDSKSILT